MSDLPKGWTRSILGNLGKMLSGGTPDTKDPSNWGGGIAWATPTDITNLDGKTIIQTEKTLSQRGLDTSSATLVPENSVLICTRATLGECAINKIPMATNQGFKNLIPHNHIGSEFLYYTIQFLKKEIVKRAAGSTFLEISGTELRGIPLNFPPRKERERIVEILSDTDAAISIVERLLDRERAVACLVLAKLLKKENQTLPIADLVDFQKGKPVTIAENLSGNPYIGSASFDGHFTEFSSDIKGIPCVETDVLLLWDGENAGKVATGLTGVVGSTVARLRPKEGTNNDFLCGALRIEFERIQLIREGSGIPHLPRDFLKRFRVPLVSVDRQREIAAVMIEQREQQRILIRKITALRKQKRGLMQKLLTGNFHILQKGEGQ